MSVADFGAVPQNWCWRSLGPVESREQWQHLLSWVGWLRGRYPIADQLPACWWRHSELVEELTALWVAWLAAYTEPSAPLTAPIDFHDRWFPQVLVRVRRWGVQCQDEHRPRPPSIYGDRGVDDPIAFAGFAAFTAFTRDGGPPARPAAEADPQRWPDRFPSSAVRCLLDEGYARPAGDAEDGAILIHRDYWVPCGPLYVRVTDPTLHAQIAAQDQQSMLTAGTEDGSHDPGPVPAEDGQREHGDKPPM